MNKKNRGFTLVEVMIAVVIISLLFLTIMNINYLMSRQGTRVNEKAFATQKVIQMMEELQALVAGSEAANIVVLDDKDDGASYNPVLTTERNVTDPGNPLSGNALIKGAPNPANNVWKYSRQVSVIRLENEPFARKVYVRVFKSTSTAVTGGGEVLAETVSVLKTIGSQYVPTQVYDLYVLAIENIPGWWVALSQIKPKFNTIIDDLQNRNPGLVIRTHWITTSTYGRDPYYTPYLNKTTRTDNTVMPSVYFYPGLINAAGFIYYPADGYQGRIRIESGVINPNSYSPADQYNHGVRYPEEVSTYNELVYSASMSGAPKPEISLRMLIEKLNSTTEIQNALIVNLHGELLPMPPMRNYSDAAKDPGTDAPLNHPDRFIRVVTHPEKIRYNAGEDVTFRVYTYVMETANPGYPNYVDNSTRTVSLFFPAQDFTDVAGLGPRIQNIVRIRGNSSTSYTQNPPLPVPPASGDYVEPGGNYKVTKIVDLMTGLVRGTRIDLLNTPLLHTAAPDNTGLPNAAKLYNLQYIPCAFNSSFANDLTSNVNGPKNTARWVITIRNLPASYSMENPLPIETRIGTNLAEGAPGNKPENISNTYVWINQPVPVTEQYQFLGDPRHMPYSDVMTNDGYNWCWKNVDSVAYPGFDKVFVSNGWITTDPPFTAADDRLFMDIPRYFSAYRNGFLHSNTIFNSITGWSFYYVGIGGEMGYDAANGFSQSLPFIETPWNPTGSAMKYVDEITNGGTHFHYSKIIAKHNGVNPPSWVALPWIGELYPDNAFATWQANGNLPTGNNNYFRADYTVAFAGTGQILSYTPMKRTYQRGCASMFNGTPAGLPGPFMHTGGSTGNIQPKGSALSTMFNFPLLTTTSALRPFTLSYNGTFPPEWSTNPYNAAPMRTTLSLRNIFYNSSNGGSYNSSAEVKVVSGADFCYYEMNGLSNMADFSQDDICKLSICCVLRQLFDAGIESVPGWISQVPMVDLVSPKDGDIIDGATVSVTNITWSSAWKRWNGSSYTEDYPANYPVGYPDATTPIVYSLEWSKDNGVTWKYCDDNTTTAVPGVKNLSHVIPAPATSVMWDISNTATFGRGNYIVRVECYRQNNNLHYSFRQAQVYINR